MKNELDWGGTTASPGTGVYPVLHQGKTLFVVRHKQVEFPAADVTIWPLTSITSIGYLTTEPTQFRVEATGLTSKDGIICHCVFDLEVQLKQERDWRIKAALGHAGLYGSFCLIVRNVSASIFKQFNYSDLYLHSVEMRAELTSQIERSVKSDTPYLLRKIIVDSVASDDPSVDEDIRLAKSIEITAEKKIFSERRFGDVQEQKRSLEESSEKRILNHQAELEEIRRKVERDRKIQDETDRLFMQRQAVEQELGLEDERARKSLEWETQRAQKRLEHAANLYQALNGDPDMWLATNHPELYGKMKMNDSSSKREVAIALQQLMQEHAHDRGVTETLKGITRQLQMGLSKHGVDVNTERQQDKDDENDVP